MNAAICIIIITTNSTITMVFKLSDPKSFLRHIRNSGPTDDATFSVQHDPFFLRAAYVEHMELITADPNTLPRQAISKPDELTNPLTRV